MAFPVQVEVRAVDSCRRPKPFIYCDLTHCVLHHAAVSFFFAWLVVQYVVAGKRQALKFAVLGL